MLLKTFTISLLLMMAQPAAHTQQLQPTHQLDIKKSKMLWNTGKFMGGHSGYLLFNAGSLSFSPAGEPLNGVFSMDMNSLRSTDNPVEENRKKTDASLRMPDFFDAVKYPTSSIHVKKITRIGSSNNFKVLGDLTIKGITNPVLFTATIDTKVNTTRITGNVDIQRQLWNIDSKPKENSVNLMTGLKESLVPDIHVSLDLVLNK